mmetsp:Transcript_55763/g.154354  ORF Transcript_55763/g.154354 Transcript_55763/m.154354 type:complete len:84 (-) Transcript_55763:444-695(-)
MRAGLLCGVQTLAVTAVLPSLGDAQLLCANADICSASVAVVMLMSLPAAQMHEHGVTDWKRRALHRMPEVPAASRDELQGRLR